jgi:regulator of RNase E activity RraA
VVVINERVVRVKQSIIDAYRSTGVGDIGHILEASGFMDVAIKPVYRDVKVVGPALTAKMPPGDIGLNRKVIELAEPGDVIVIDRCGDVQYACWGGAVTLYCKVKGIEAMIVDGSVTDSMEITDMQWPVFARAVSGCVGRKLEKGGGVNIPIQCGGVVVHPGDLIVADDDGIAVIDPDAAEDLLKQVQDRFSAVPPIRKWIADGKPLDEHPNADLIPRKK